jgi:hypothetical protein
VSYGIIYVLGLKWALKSLKLVKHDSCTSLLLGIAVFLNFSDISQRMKIALWNLMTGSFVHHLLLNKYSLAIDNINITFACLAFLRLNVVPSIIIAVLSGIQVVMHHTRPFEGVICKAVYGYTMLCYSTYDMVKLLGIGILCGYFSLMKYGHSFMWHLLNGMYLHYVTRKEFLIGH